MTKIIPLAVQPRDRAGKGAARATRRDGRVPAVIYGNKQDPALISLDPKVLKQQIKGGGFFSHVFEIELSGNKEMVLPRDLQLDPVTDRPIHVDFMRVTKDTRITVGVPVNFVNELASPGLKRGGVLNIVLHEIPLVCSPENIPERIVIDLTGLEIGHSIHMDHVNLPEGVVPDTHFKDNTVATIVAPSAMKSEVEAAPAEAEAAAAPAAAPAAGAKKG
ncbi:MAG: 50S ribosomal protein L25/general stress protein Ctc [Magnetospirillum sp. WYHS-4]